MKQTPSIEQQVEGILGHQSQWLELSGAHKAGEALGSTCVGVWASGTGDTSVKAARTLRSACWCQATRSLRNCCRHGRTKHLGSRRPESYLLPHSTRSHGNCCQLRGTKPVSSRNSGARMLAQASKITVQWHCCQHRGAKPAGSRNPGACLLAPTTRSHSSCSWLWRPKAVCSRSSWA
jgi:hypothetical protein